MNQYNQQENYCEVCGCKVENLYTVCDDCKSQFGGTLRIIKNIEAERNCYNAARIDGAIRIILGKYFPVHSPIAILKRRIGNKWQWIERKTGKSRDIITWSEVPASNPFHSAIEEALGELADMERELKELHSEIVR